MQRLGELTQYGSSDEGEASESSPPPAKRRKLPSLPESLRRGAPIDDPALHQGRVRTSPHIEGQYAAYVYLPLIVERRSPLYKLLSKAFASAKRAVPSLHSIGLPESPQTGNIQPRSGEFEDEHVPDVELHISLTRPVYLRAHQREDLKRAVKAIAKSHPAYVFSTASMIDMDSGVTADTTLSDDDLHSTYRLTGTSERIWGRLTSETCAVVLPCNCVHCFARFFSFPASLASFSELTNDERTRTFLAVEIGAGHDQLKTMSDGLIPALRSLKQKNFYTEPRFHASFAWALLHGTYPSATTTENLTALSPAATPSPKPLSASMATDPTHPESNSGKTAAESSPKIFPTIPRFPPSLVHSLNDEFGEMLRARHVGTFDAREVHVKIGKDVFKWTLSGE